MIGLLKKIETSLKYRKVETQLLRRNDVSCDAPMFFVVSAGRSGSTLLRKHLLANADVGIPPESEDFIAVAAQIWLEDLTYEMKVSRMINKLSKTEYFSYWNLNWEKLKSELLKKDSREISLGEVILEFYREGTDNASYVGDKTPYLVYYLDWIKAIFPNCKIVYMIRDGRAVANSYVVSRGYDLDQASKRWRASISSFLKSKCYKEKDYCLVKYENFVRTPEIELQRVCEFTGISYSAAMLDPKFEEMGDTHLSHHKNVKKELNADALEKWKEALSSEQITRLEKELRKELVLFNYPLQNE